MNRASVYVHFPWCIKKCPYCDFATRKIDPKEIPHGRYADAVIRELELRGQRNGTSGFENTELVSVFLGGGTPSLWDPRQLGRVIDAILGAFPKTAPKLEITAECNPSSLDETTAAGFREAGINRLSIGIQALSDDRLKFLGRAHDRAGALAALDAASKYFDRLSADFMFGTPGQTQEDVSSDLCEVTDRGLRHVSAYALTIEPGTQFGELHRKGRLPVAPEEDYARLFEYVELTLESRGLRHYEVSNYATPGEESIHNLHYWRNGSYLGLGAAAVGCLRARGGRARRWRNQPDGLAYIDSVGTELDKVEVEVENLGPEDTAREGLMLGLRTREGVNLDELARWSGVDVAATRGLVIERRMRSGDLEMRGPWLSVPTNRWLLLDSIVADLF